MWECDKHATSRNMSLPSNANFDRRAIAFYSSPARNSGAGMAVRIVR